MTRGHSRSLKPESLLLLDVDRTILRSEAFSRYVYQALLELGVPEAVLERVAGEQEQSVSNAYDYIGRITELAPEGLSAGLVDDVVTEIAASHQPDGEWSEAFCRDVLVSGASELIAAAQTEHRQVVLCTSGGEKTQRIKLAIVLSLLQAKLPWVIVAPDQQRKAAIVAGVYDARFQVFNIKRYVDQATAAGGFDDWSSFDNIRRIDVIDDKLANIEGVASGVPVYGWLAEAAELPPDGRNRRNLTDIASQLA